MRLFVTLSLVVLISGCLPHLRILRPGLRGQLLGEDGKPVDTATIIVYTAQCNDSLAPNGTDVPTATSFEEEMVTDAEGRFDRAEDSQLEVDALFGAKDGDCPVSVALACRAHVAWLGTAAEGATIQVGNASRTWSFAASGTAARAPDAAIATFKRMCGQVP